MRWRGADAALTIGLIVAIAAVATSLLAGSEGVARYMALRAERQELGRINYRPHVNVPGRGPAGLGAGANALDGSKPPALH